MCAYNCGNALTIWPMCSRTAKCMLELCWKGCPRGPCCSSIWATLAFHELDDLTMRSLGMSLACERASYTVVHMLYESEEVFDALVWLGKHQARAGHVARLVRVRVGCRAHGSLTNGWAHACSRWANRCGCMRADGISNWRSCCSKSTCTCISGGIVN